MRCCASDGGVLGLPHEFLDRITILSILIGWQVGIESCGLFFLVALGEPASEVERGCRCGVGEGGRDEDRPHEVSTAGDGEPRRCLEFGQDLGGLVRCPARVPMQHVTVRVVQGLDPVHVARL